MSGQSIRVGFGLDIHPWGRDRPLMLGGVRFDGEPGLSGHSDGDAVCHAVADAVLGSVGLGDLGHHFPDTDPRFAGMEGADLLARVVAMAADGGSTVTHCDVTVLAERPAIGPRRDEIRLNLARVLGLAVEDVSVKATRPEGLGLTGDGVGCMAVVTTVRLSSG
jgi:2-C-methyl-D-erythritol 2,4-cyclodiphosphate synthase